MFGENEIPEDLLDCIRESSDLFLQLQENTHQFFISKYDLVCPSLSQAVTGVTFF